MVACTPPNASFIDILEFFSDEFLFVTYYLFYVTNYMMDSVLIVESIDVFLFTNKYKIEKCTELMAYKQAQTRNVLNGV